MSKRARVMVDIETLGTSPGCIILSIGAVKFNTDGLGAKFYRSVNAKSCEAAGLTADMDTLDWWLSQDKDAQEVLTGGRSLKPVLNEFSTFYKGSSEIWANAPTFDCSIMRAAYHALDMDEPWNYYDERCYRTLKTLPGYVKVEMEGTKHDALDDAKHQAEAIVQTLQNMESNA